MMDWPNERYIRLYTRDTKTWLKMGWEGRALFALLLRKVDRAGILDDITEPNEDIALITGLPIDVATKGLAKLSKLGVVSITDDGQLLIPNFLDAQETPRSDKMRKRESRERRRDDAGYKEGVTKRDLMSRGVTKRDLMSRGVTKRDLMSRGVTGGHVGSQEVTPNCAIPPRTDPMPPRTDPIPCYTDPDIDIGQVEDLEDLKPRSQEIYRAIRADWPEYDPEQARYTAVALGGAPQFQDLDIATEVQAARVAWPPGRTVHERNGLHGFLSAWIGNALDRQRNNSFLRGGRRMTTAEAKTAEQDEFLRHLEEIEAKKQ